MESHDHERTTEAGAPAGSEDPTTPHRPPARRLYKSRDDRMIAGVCGGIAEYFGIDPVIVRVVAVALVFLGLAGLGVWYLASGEQPAAGGVRDVLRRAGFGLALLAVCGILAIGGAWATAAGGGTVVAVVIVVLGLWLVASAFIGGARWLILPALALALPAGVVSAADLDVRGGIGERQYRPLAADQVRDTYRLGVGQLIVDLREAKLPAGDRRLHIDLGVGQAVLVVPRNVCVATSARLGAGEVNVFDRNSGGVDVDWQDERTAPPGRTRIVVDGDVGVGQLAVTYHDPDAFRHNDFHDTEPGNATCIGGARG